MPKSKTPLAPPEAGVAWRNAIVGHGEAAPDTLLPNPQNWRRHPVMQQAAMTGALTELGWLQTVTVNQRTGHLIDGHLRVVLALAHQQPLVPVTYVDISAEQERLALLTINPLGAMADANANALQELLTMTSAMDAGLHQVLDAPAIEHQLLSPLFADELPEELGPGRNGPPGEQQAGGLAQDDVIDMTPVPAPASNVRMVQLFLTEELYPTFQDYIKVLAPRYGVTTVTETVLECLKHAAALPHSPE